MSSWWQLWSARSRLLCGAIWSPGSRSGWSLTDCARGASSRSTSRPENHAWDNRYEPPAAGGSVLTDDLNPVDLWAEAINLEARKVLHGDTDWYRLAW